MKFYSACIQDCFQRPPLSAYRKHEFIYVRRNNYGNNTGEYRNDTGEYRNDTGKSGNAEVSGQNRSEPGLD